MEKKKDNLGVFFCVSKLTYLYASHCFFNDYYYYYFVKLVSG